MKKMNSVSANASATLSVEEFTRRAKAQIEKSVISKSFKYSFLDKESLEGLSQEIFAKVWKARDSFDSSKAKLETWVTTVSTNYIKDYVDKWNHNEARTISIDSNMSWKEDDSFDEDATLKSLGWKDFEPSVSDSIEKQEEYDYLLSVVRGLSEIDQKVIFMTADNYSTEAIAEELGCDEKRVSSILFHARQRAKKALGYTQRGKRARREVSDSSDDLSFFCLYLSVG